MKPRNRIYLSMTNERNDKNFRLSTYFFLNGPYDSGAVRWKAGNRQRPRCSIRTLLKPRWQITGVTSGVPFVPASRMDAPNNVWRQSFRRKRKVCKQRDLITRWRSHTRSRKRFGQMAKWNVKTSRTGAGWIGSTRKNSRLPLPL